MATCKHKWVYRNSDSFWHFDGRNTRSYHHIDYYYCEKCLEEKSMKKDHFCYDSEISSLPDWAKTITKKVHGYE